MNRDKAESLLQELSEHYGEPVQPVSRYCDSLTTWFRLVHKHPRFHWGEHVPSILLAISKSNLLARLIYGGEKLRETPCPTHQGRWSGCFVVPCGHGCRDVGWLPEAHAFEPVTIEGWGHVPTRTICQRCGGIEGAEVHGLTAEDSAARREAMAAYRQCLSCRRESTADASVPFCPFCVAYEVKP